MADTVRQRAQAVPFNLEQCEAICNEMAEGRSLRQILREPGMPQRQTVMTWLLRGVREPESDFAVFKKAYEFAREAQADAMFDTMADIAEDQSDDGLIDAKGRPMGNPVKVNRDRLRIETIKFRLSKLWPKKYGDHSHATVKHIGANPGEGEQPVRTALEITFVDPKAAAVEEAVDQALGEVDPASLF